MNKYLKIISKTHSKGNMKNNKISFEKKYFKVLSTYAINKQKLQQ